jgi:hypothetical protein
MNHPLHPARRVWLWCSSVLLSITAGCSSVAVSVDRDPSVDFSQYKSFDWVSVEPPAPADAPGGTMVDMLDQTLTAHGLEHRSDHPDLLVEIHRSVAGTVNTPSWGLDHEPMQEATLIVDLIDPRTLRSVWRATANTLFPVTTDPEERSRRHAAILREMFAGFPSGS